MDETKKPSYILITHGDSYLGRVMAIYLSEKLLVHKKQPSQTLRVLCKEGSPVKKMFKKLGIEVKTVDYESRKMIEEAMEGQIKTMIFNPVSDGYRLINEARLLVEIANESQVNRIVMLSVVGASVEARKQADIFGGYRETEEYLRRVNGYGPWCIFRVPMIQQYLYFWQAMIEDQSEIAMPLSYDDKLETIHVQDVCRAIAYAVFSARLPGKRVHALKSNPVLSFQNITESLSHVLGERPTIQPVIATEEQTKRYLERMSVNKPEVFSSEDPRWYPHQALTPFLIQLILQYFRLARNPAWLPEVDNRTDLRDLTGAEATSLTEFFKKNQREFQKDVY
ncbi:hypothetical protein BY458DRAFT_525915 [Sporodiniella umbellata]|nr:hypothetical protein BY458DRAFT_525915 [Sporodiniella umbellata]